MISGAQLIAEVESLGKAAGDRYDYGGTSPSTGFDCSGLIYDALRTLGYSNVPRTSEEQYAWSTKVSADDLQPGDLVFAQFPGDNASPGHVGIYIGNGQVYSAQDPQLGIGTSSLASWGSAIVGYGRVPSETTTASDVSTDSLLGGVFSWPTEITDFFKDADTFVSATLWLVNPASWLRIGSFGIGVVLLLGAIFLFAKVGSDGPIFNMPAVVPVPV